MNRLSALTASFQKRGFEAAAPLRVKQRVPAGALSHAANPPSTAADFSWVLVGILAATYAVTIEAVPQALVFILSVALLGYGACCLLFRGPAKTEQRSAYVQTFSAAVLAIAIARTMAVFFDDQLQNSSDAGSFFQAAAFVLRETDIYEVRLIINGWGAVWLWSEFYRIAHLFFPSPTPLVGLSVNALVLALGGAILVDAATVLARAVGGAPRVTKRLYVWCFLFWLFASFHLRDAMTVFLTIVTLRVWLWLYERHSVMRWCLATALSAGLFWAIGTIREESTSIIVVTVIVGVAGLLSRTSGALRLIITLFGLLALFVSYQVVYVRLMGAADILKFYQEGYQFDLGDQSLGNRLIISRSTPVRSVLGFAYLHVFPIPAWNGFTLGSPYYWFKSLQLLHMAMLLPAAIAGALALARRKTEERSYLILLVGVYVVISVAVGLSSLETRHSSQVIPCLMLLAAVTHQSRTEARLRAFVFAGLVGIHVFWAILKFF